MWQNAATQRNVERLRARRRRILGPTEGDHADREGGMGRMLEPEEIFAEVAAGARPQGPSKKKVLITAGPTYEPIDTVPGVTNQSSGKKWALRPSRRRQVRGRRAGEAGIRRHRACRPAGVFWSAWTC